MAEGKRPNEPNYGREAFILGVGMKVTRPETSINPMAL